MTSCKRWQSKQGFSLAELLITLAIIGVLATFTIPPLFTGSMGGNSAKYTNYTRDVAYMIMSAYEQYRAANSTVPSTMKASDLTPYMNYVSQLPAATVLDAHANSGGAASGCNGTTAAMQGVCLRLHNGGALWADTASNFGGSTTLSIVSFRFDPNVTYEGAGVQDAPGMGIQLSLYYDGTIKTRATLRSNSSFYDYGSGSIIYASAAANTDPSWFTGF